MFGTRNSLERISYTASALFLVTRVTDTANRAVHHRVCGGGFFIAMRFALGPDNAERCQLSCGGGVERDGVFCDIHALHGDQQENDGQCGDQFTDAKARTTLLRSSDFSEVGHFNSPSTPKGHFGGTRGLP